MRNAVAREIGRPIMPLSAWHLGQNIGKQGAAQRHVHHLNAAANTQKWHLGFSRLAHQLELQRITRRIDAVHRGVRLAVENDRVDVPAAGQQQSVQPGQQLGNLPFCSPEGKITGKPPARNTA